MASKRLKTLLVCALSIMLCVTAVAVGTYALFSDNVTVKNHLQAGTLKATLTRTLLKKSEIGTDGYLNPSEDGNAKDFTNSTTDDDNIFDLSDGAILVPGSMYEATMKIENKGTVAFDYNVTVVLTTPQGTESEAFANQLKFTTGKVGETGTSTTLAAAGSNPIFSGFLKGGDASAESFFIKIEFVNEDGTVNNAAQAGDVKFDLVVTATQQTTAPTAGN